jgi:hypothetical protein
MEAEVAAEVKEYVQQAVYRPQVTQHQHSHHPAFENSKPVPVDVKPEAPVKDVWDRYAHDKSVSEPAMSDDEWEQWKNKHFATGIEEPTVSDEEETKIIHPGD